MPEKGLEPPRLAALAPEASASTNFATRAFLIEKSATADSHFVSGCKSKLSAVIVKSPARLLSKMSRIDLLLLDTGGAELGLLVEGGK